MEQQNTQNKEKKGLSKQGWFFWIMAAFFALMGLLFGCSQSPDTAVTPQEVQEKSDAGDANLGQVENPQENVLANKDLGFSLPYPQGFRVKTNLVVNDPEDEEPLLASYTFEKEENPAIFFNLEIWKHTPKFNADESFIAPVEGALSDQFTQIASGQKAYIYLSDAEGFSEDAHTTVFTENHIYYFRSNVKNEVSEDLTAFTRNFHLTQEVESF